MSGDLPSPTLLFAARHLPPSRWLTRKPDAGYL